MRTDQDNSMHVELPYDPDESFQSPQRNMVHHSSYLNTRLELNTGEYGNKLRKPWFHCYSVSY